MQKKRAITWLRSSLFTIRLSRRSFPLPIGLTVKGGKPKPGPITPRAKTMRLSGCSAQSRSEEHTSELQSQSNLVCRLLLEKKKNAEESGSDIGRGIGGIRLRESEGTNHLSRGNDRGRSSLFPAASDNVSATQSYTHTGARH